MLGGSTPTTPTATATATASASSNSASARPQSTTEYNQMQQSAQPPPPHPGSMSARANRYPRHDDDSSRHRGIVPYPTREGRKSLPAFSSAAATTYPAQHANMTNTTASVDYYSTPHHRRHYPYSSHTSPQVPRRSRSRDNGNGRARGPDSGSGRSFAYDSYHQQPHYAAASSLYFAPAYAPSYQEDNRSHRDRRQNSSRSRSPSPRKSRHSSHHHSHRSPSSSSHSRESSSQSSSDSRDLRGSRSDTSSHSHSNSTSDSHSHSESDSHSDSGSEDEGSESDADSSARDDTEGLITIKTGEMIRDRYEVISTAGQGTFGTVLDCYDHQTHTRVALKIIRAVERYIEAALVEVDILEKIRKADVHNQSLCVKFIRHFHIRHNGREHLVLAFEKLGRSLYEFLKKNSYRGFSLENVARFGYQLLTSIQFCHSIELIHTDLKLENILLKSSEYRTVKDYNRFKQEAAMMDVIQKEEENKRKSRKSNNNMTGGAASSSSAPSNTSAAASSSASPSRGSGYASDTMSESSAFLAATAANKLLNEKANEDDGYREPVDTSIRLIDFGGATFEREHHSRIVNTRQYRAPEVILGCGWSYPSDIWSVGAILVELFTGELLFGTHADLEHLALMEKILEQPLSETLTRKAIEPFAKKLGFNPESTLNAANQTIEAAASKRAKRRQAREKRRENEDGSESSSSSRGRSSSAPRADLLIHLRTAKLLWPQCAISDSSIKTVRKAQTLKQLLPDADFLDLVRKLLTYDPAQRITARNALAHPFFRHVRREYEKQLERERSEREKQNRRHSEGHRHDDRKKSGSSRVSSSRSDGRRHSDHHHHDHHRHHKHDRHHHHSPSHRDSRHRSSTAKDSAAAASSSSHSHHQRNASSNKRKRSRSRSQSEDESSDDESESSEEEDEINEESESKREGRSSHSHRHDHNHRRSHRDESYDSRGRPSKRKK